MPRVFLRTAIAGAVLAISALTAQAQAIPPRGLQQGPTPVLAPVGSQPRPIARTAAVDPAPVPVTGQPLPVPANFPPHQRGAYPYLHAPMYPTPQPNIPYQVGQTVITNQAFYPQEMLYRHEYDAMYAPFYYQVHGYWMLMPWGVVTVEDWELQGTEVEVEYRPHIPLRSMFVRPYLR